MTPRILLIDDDVEEYSLLNRALTHIQFVWLPSMVFAESLLIHDKKFDEILLDISGTSLPGRWEKELLDLADIYGGTITAISSVFTPMESPVSFYHKDKIIEVLRKKYPQPEKA